MTDMVKVLSDDEIDRLLTPHRFDGFLVLKPDGRDSLCATVRALRAGGLTMQAAYDKATGDLK